MQTVRGSELSIDISTGCLAQTADASHRIENRDTALRFVPFDDNMAANRLPHPASNMRIQ